MTCEEYKHFLNNPDAKVMRDWLNTLRTHWGLVCALSAGPCANHGKVPSNTSTFSRVSTTSQTRGFPAFGSGIFESVANVESMGSLASIVEVQDEELREPQSHVA